MVDPGIKGFDMEKGLIFVWLIIVLFLFILIGSHTYSYIYQRGFDDGKSSVDVGQIFDRGFDRGVDFEKNWTRCKQNYWDYWSYRNPDKTKLCNKLDPDLVRYVDRYYNTSYEHREINITSLNVSYSYQIRYF